MLRTIGVSEDFCDDTFGDIVLKTADLCSAKDDCVRLKNA
ncbi:IgaA/UmoB family intracellular growth attenuator, partial [Escherichia sp. SS-MK2]